jgi:minor histocompatibility antigen H13
MGPRASAALSAIDDAMAGLPPDADRKATGEAASAAAAAALSAYDAVAERDDARREASTGGAEARGEFEASEDGRARAAVTDAVLQQRTYFEPVMWAYCGGLVVAFVANAVTGLGQPALLYLCPATLGAVALVGLRRRETGRLWSFVDLAAPSPLQPTKLPQDKDDAN